MAGLCNERQTCNNVQLSAETEPCFILAFYVRWKVLANREVVSHVHLEKEPREENIQKGEDPLKSWKEEGDWTNQSLCSGQIRFLHNRLRLHSRQN